MSLLIPPLRAPGYELGLSGHPIFLSPDPLPLPSFPCSLPTCPLQTPPKVLKLHAADVPTYTTPTGARVRVIAGEAGGLSSPLNDQLLTKVGG